MNKSCPNCKTNTLEELGTAGFMIDGKYQNEHHWRCTKCFGRFDQANCTCSGTCAANFKHHQDSFEGTLPDGRTVQSTP